MIIKGKSVAGAKRLAVHLGRADTNERVELIETRGVVAEDLAGALKEMEAVASAARNCERPFYHASINTPTHEKMTVEQRDAAIERLATALHLEHQPRVVVAHVKGDREHIHVVFSRVEADRGFRVISDSHNYRTHETVARALEREFGHAPVQGAHMEREGRKRPERTPSHKELQQGERTKIPVTQARAEVSALWQSADSGQAFRAALQEAGWTLAKGDRRDFVVIDGKGGVHSLTRVTGASAAAVRKGLAGIDRDQLSTPDAVRQQLKARAAQAAEAQAAHRVIRDGIALSGRQGMAQVQGAQMRIMRRQALAAERQLATAQRGERSPNAADGYRQRMMQARSEGRAIKEATDKRLARDGKVPGAAEITRRQRGKGESEQDRS